MDKGQLPAEKLMNPESNEDNGGSNDDVEILPLHDNVSIQHNIAVSQAAKSTNRGKDIADKKPDVKTASEVTTTYLTIFINYNTKIFFLPLRLLLANGPRGTVGLSNNLQLSWYTHQCACYTKNAPRSTDTPKHPATIRT